MWGISRSSANSGPTCPVSASLLFLPQIIRSAGSSRNADARAIAVANVSDPASARSVSNVPLSAPKAKHSSIPSRACGGPILIMLTSSSGEDLALTAQVTPSKSKGFTSDGTPSLMIVFCS